MGGIIWIRVIIGGALDAFVGRVEKISLDAGETLRRETVGTVWEERRAEGAS